MAVAGRPDCDDIFRITPCCRVSICRSAAWQPMKVPVRLIRRIASHRSSVHSMNGATREMPALFTLISAGPSRAAISSAARSTVARSATSSGQALACPPVARISAATSSAAAGRRSVRPRRALGHERPADRRADAASAAGNDRYLVLKSHNCHSVSPAVTHPPSTNNSWPVT